MTPSRRSFLTGLGATLITAPAIVRAASLMPVKAMPSVEDLNTLLKQRMNECYEIIKKNMIHTLYGGRLVWADGADIHVTEILPEQIYKNLEVVTPVAFTLKPEKKLVR